MRKPLLRGAVLASTLLFSTVQLAGTASASHEGCAPSYDDTRFVGARPYLDPDPVEDEFHYWSTTAYGPTQVTVAMATYAFQPTLSVYDSACALLCEATSFPTVSCPVNYVGDISILIDFEQRNGSTPLAYTLTSTPSGVPQPLPQCHDHLDNDADGQADYPNDSGCSSATDDSELTLPEVDPACSDGVDNDLNGQTDYPADAGCDSADDPAELTLPQVDPACSDGRDNDLNGHSDYPADPGCDSASDATEATVPAVDPDPACSDGLDNDANGRTDYPNDPGCESAGDATELSVTPPPNPDTACDDGLDNDLDGATDYPADSGCTSAADDSEGLPDPVDPTPSCDPGATVPVCVDVDPGAVYQTVSAYDVGTTPAASATVVGRVQRYRVPLPTGGSVVVDCLVLTANSQSVNPCAQAGGVYLDTTLTLVNESRTVSGPVVGAPLPLVKVCHADYTVTVAGRGVEDIPGFAIC